MSTSLISTTLTVLRERNRAIVDSASMKRASGTDLSSLFSSGESSGLLGSFANSSEHKQKYRLYRGWVYSAINALAEEAGGQPVQMGRVSGKGASKSSPSLMKSMTKSARSKAASVEIENIIDHPILTKLNHPNPIQMRYQFVYTFLANLCLTGYGYIVSSQEPGSDTPEFYALPTTWVRPDHTNGPFSRFYINDPDKPIEKNAKPLDRSQVAFAYLPDPSNPFQAKSPSSAQMAGIQIDDKIQSSQVEFFDNGIFPSVVVTVGKNPHPSLGSSGGSRPRLSPEQRRQVQTAIKKVMGGVQNYGNAAIVDGLIERIDRFSATQNEMGWEKSEKSVRTRILAPFGVHPFILGDEMVGSYAQAYIVQERFYEKVNSFLDLLGSILTQFVPPFYDENGIVIWYESKKAHDPSLEQALWTKSRQQGDVTQNEIRAFMGLPPDEDSNQSFLNEKTSRIVLELAKNVYTQQISPEQGVAILISMGLPNEMAVEIAGNGENVANQLEQVERMIQQISH